MNFRPNNFFLAVCLLAVPGGSLRAADWPMWRGDAGRSNVSAESLPENLDQAWVLQLPPLKPAYRDSRLQFDAGYEPIAVGDLLIVGSSRNDSVTAYSVETGQRRWRYFAEGPVRFAPCAWQDRVLFGSDDGYVYCLKQDTGKLIWRFQAAPNHRKLLGNQRMISVWPVRGGPVVADDRVYFAAGVFSFEGIFIYALDAETGEVDWLNDRTGSIYGVHPHGAEAMGGLAPQGYLLVNGDELIVPCGSAYPARFNRETGELLEFQLPKQGRYPGGWFAALDKETARDLRRGKVAFDEAINQKLHEDKVYHGAGQPGVRSTIQFADRELKLEDGWPGVEEDVHSMLAANGRLFVVTKNGAIHCFAASNQNVIPDRQVRRIVALRNQPYAHLKEISPTFGHALIAEMKDAAVFGWLARHTEMSIIGIAADADRLVPLRNELDAVDWYGTRVALLGGATAGDLPPYFADFVVYQPKQHTMEVQIKAISKLYRNLRPFGGTLCVDLSDAEHEQLAQSIGIVSLPGAKITRLGGTTVVRRTGALPDSANYVGQWQMNRDEIVKAPLGVLWFDDALGHFKRSPQPEFRDGIMISRPKNWSYPKKTEAPHNVDYPLLAPVLSDVYTGRILVESEATTLRDSLPSTDPEKREPSQYRPPRQKDAWKPEPPTAGERVNPLTGEQETRAFPKSYGCDGGLDYGLIYTMRSGTPAIYDKSLESGTINISGPRSGCTNSIIPACGVLNLPYFYEGCTCSYPLPVGFAMVSMPETYEQWATWGESTPTNIQRLGINFGAPGDRVTRDGTLWLDYPNVGGPSPSIQVSTTPADLNYYYQHSSRIRGGRGWPWVSASGVEGLSSLEISNIRPGRYTVRLYFAEPDKSDHPRHPQKIEIQGETVTEEFDVAAKANGKMRSLVIEKKDVEIETSLQISLDAQDDGTLISGVEIVADDLQLGPIVSLNDRRSRSR